MGVQPSSSLPTLLGGTCLVQMPGVFLGWWDLSSADARRHLARLVRPDAQHYLVGLVWNKCHAIFCVTCPHLFPCNQVQPSCSPAVFPATWTVPLSSLFGSIFMLVAKLDVDITACAPRSQHFGSVLGCIIVLFAR